MGNACSPRVVGPSVFVSGSSDLLSAAPFYDRGLQFYETLAPFPSDPSAAEPRCARRRTPLPRIPGSKPGDRGQRQADRSDVRQEYARLKRARSGFEPLDSGRAPALHACERLTTPALSLGFAHARRMRPLSVGRLENAFHPATDHDSEFQFCKENATKGFSERRRRRLIALAVRGSPCPSLSLVNAPMLGSQEKRIALGNSPAASREEFVFDSSIVYALDAFQLSRSRLRRPAARSMTVVCRRVLNVARVGAPNIGTRR